MGADDGSVQFGVDRRDVEAMRRGGRAAVESSMQHMSSRDVTAGVGRASGMWERITIHPIWCRSSGCRGDEARAVGQRQQHSTALSDSDMVTRHQREV